MEKTAEMDIQIKRKTPYQLAREAFDSYAHLDAPELPKDELSALQVLVGRWEVGNFGYSPTSKNVLGVSEELGEMSEMLALFFGLTRAIGRLSHIELKSSQGIRGFDDKEYAREQIADAISDVWVFGFNLCTALRLDGGVILRETIKKVIQRNWKKDPKGTKAT